MAEPASFKQSNMTWKGWQAFGNREEVSDLPAHRQGNQTISCWKLSWRERLEVLLSGRAWLYVIGRQPPVCVMGRNPFAGES